MNDTMNNDRDDSKIRKQQKNNRWPSKRSSSKLFLSSFLRNETGPGTRIVLFFTTRFNAFENVGVGTSWNTNEKKKKKRGRKNLLKQRISSPPRIFPRARFEKRRIHSTRNRFVQTLLLHPSWKVGERVVPWMRGEPFWERGDGTSLDEKPARKKMVPKGRRKCGVKSGEGWSALNYESTGTTLGMGELSPE